MVVTGYWDYSQKFRQDYSTERRKHWDFKRNGVEEKGYKSKRCPKMLVMFFIREIHLFGNNSIIIYYSKKDINYYYIL